MKILVLGGTLFLGRHIVDAAQRHGHEVTTFNRGRTDPEPRTGVVAIHGDRDDDLDRLRDVRFDVVIDTSAYHPAQVVRAAAVLSDVARYVLISTASVYSRFPATEESPTHEANWAQDAVSGPLTYAGLKRACEEAVLEAFGERATILRPGVLAGPRDPTNRLEYWVRRGMRAGDILAPGNRHRLVQLLDARDLAAWIVEHAIRTPGIFNVAGPEKPLTMEEMLAACLGAAPSGARLVWVSDSFLLSQGVTPWTDLPLWIPDDAGPILQVDVTRARAAGLRCRPFQHTVADVRQAPSVSAPLAGGMKAAAPLAAAAESRLLAEWRSSEENTMANPGRSFHEFEHAGWENESVCATYDQHLSRVTRQSVDALLEAVGARRGVRLLDIATGAGYVAGAAAERGAEATGVDFSATQIALARKTYAGVQFQEADAEALPFASESFDAIVNAFGTCHFPHPEVALKEALRVLKRGGRLAFTVWAVPERAVPFGALYAAVKEHGAMEVGLPSGPNFFLFSDPEYSKRALSAAGFTSVSVREIPQVWRVDNPDRVFDVLTRGSVRAAATLKAQSEKAKEAIKAQLRETFSAYRAEGGYAIPAPAILIAAVRP